MTIASSAVRSIQSFKEHSGVQSSTANRKLTANIPDYHEIFSTLQLNQIGPATYTTTIHRDRCYGAAFKLPQSIAPLFPYMNSVIEEARYNSEPEFIRFIYEKRLCMLHAHQGIFTPVANFGEATEFLRILLDFINTIRCNLDEIVPDHRAYCPSSPLDILRLLPGNNCGDCDYATCLAFAAAVSRQKSSPGKCPHISKPLEERSVFQVIDREGNQTGTVSLPIDTTALYKQVSEKDEYIQALQNRLSVLENCRSNSIKDNNAELATPLTKREIEVLAMVAEGATNREISVRLYISEHTVKTHVGHIFEKLNVNDRTQASVWAAKNGLL